MGTSAKGVVEVSEDQSIVGLAFCGALTPENKPKEEEKEEGDVAPQGKKDNNGKSESIPAEGVRVLGMVGFWDGVF